MSSRSRKPPMVADRSYRAPKGGGRPPREPAPAARKPAPRRRAPVRSGNPLVRLVVGLLRLIWRIVWGVAWRVGAVVALVLGLSVGYFYTTLPPVTALLDARSRGSVTMLDAEGQVFAWRGETFGGQITAANVSANLRNAIVATEDKRFYRHFGISPRGIASAVKINLSEGRGPLEGNGGSTITQQVAKLLCLGEPYVAASGQTEAQYEEACRGGGVWRKIKEVPYAMAMEAKYSKNDILTIYLNRAYLGAGARGFEAAAQRYFGKSANEVSPAEAAMLAGLLKAPTRYAPTGNIERARDRAAVVIGLMREQGYLTAAEAEEALTKPAALSAAAAARAGGYFADWVMEDAPAYLTTDTTEDVVIRTTLDQRLQRAAEAALKHVFETKVKPGSQAQAAIVVMSSDGAVRAMVGGRDNQTTGAFNRATQALRQTGSSFKPFVYAAALDLGASPYDYVVDEPITLNIRGSGPWSPKNYDDEYKGRMTLTTALKESRNIPAVKISEGVGRETVRAVANGFGIRSDLAAGPALALGASESTLLEMTGAYAGILNGGSSVKPYGLQELRIQGDDTPLMGQEGGMGERVISQTAAQELIWMMEQVVSSGTGARARIEGREVAGKTGTTTAGRDAWFIGFTADYVTGVWMGYDDNRPLTGVTGGGLPAEIWREVMVRIEDGLPAKPLPALAPAAPAPVEAAPVDPAPVTLDPPAGATDQPEAPQPSEAQPVDVADQILDLLKQAAGGN